METSELTTTFGGYATVDAYEHFISCVRNPSKRCIAPGEENVQLIKILDGIARSAKSGKEVKV
jgi:hypothetical protein